MFKVLDKNLYWSMDDKNHCIDNPIKYFEFIEKIKDSTRIFDDILNNLFNTKDEVINYLLWRNGSRENEIIGVTVESHGNKSESWYPINNSYFTDLRNDDIDKINIEENNVVAFIANITTTMNIEVYISEVNLKEYSNKCSKVIPAVVFNLPEYAQTTIFKMFQGAFIRLFSKTKCTCPELFVTREPIMNPVERKNKICKAYYLADENDYDRWLNGENILPLRTKWVD